MRLPVIGRSQRLPSRGAAFSKNCAIAGEEKDKSRPVNCGASCVLSEKRT
jgi:hypothetical protein